MLLDSMPLLVMAVLFAATFVRSAFGFGEALVAVPLLAILMPVEVAAPVAVLVSVTVAGIVVAQDWRYIHFRSAGWLILSTCVGTPLGLLLLAAVAGTLVKAILALIIISFSAHSLLARRRAALRDDRWAWLFGFSAGVLGGTYGMNGPPLVIYGALRGWSPQHLRATLQGYFLPASLLVAGGYWLTGLWTPTVTHHYLLALPAVVVAIFLGRVANQRLSSRSFLRFVHVGLIAVGITLLFQAAMEQNAAATGPATRAAQGSAGAAGKRRVRPVAERRETAVIERDSAASCFIKAWY